MQFGISNNFVYTLYINKSNYEKDKRLVKAGNNLRTNLRQHLPRWLFLPCTCKSSGRDSKQKFLKQEKGCGFPQRIAKRVIEDFLKKRVRPGCANAWAFFMSRQCNTTQDGK